MAVKDVVLHKLMEEPGEYISGEELASALSVSRNAVWKAIEQLRRDGVSISAVTNRGYALSPESDVLSAENILFLSKRGGYDIHVYKTLGSTNAELKALSGRGAPEGTVVIADEQTAGRGRLGRSFYSPVGTGLYMSLLLRPKCAVTDSFSITACAAVAVAEAIETLTGESAEIKWVNDIYVRGKKVCGILAEGTIDMENGLLNSVVLGIGVNTSAPQDGFPEELREKAGALAAKPLAACMRSKLSALILDKFMDYYEAGDSSLYYENYVNRSMLIEKPVVVTYGDKEPINAQALGIDRDYALIVRTEAGEMLKLSSGEVSVRLT